MLIIPVGISGSGKSFFGKQLEKDFNFQVVCPDDIRKELTGDISDQTKNKMVFELAHNRIINKLGDGKNVFFSATNVGFDNLCNFLNLVESSRPLVEILIILLKDSNDVELCFNRIQKQLDNGEERSTIRDKSIIERQYTNYCNVFSRFDDFKLLYKNVKIYEVSCYDDIKRLIEK